MIAMSTLHTSCSVSVDPQQQALFAIQCPDITPRTESCRSKRIESMSHMLVQLAGARSLPEASATSYTRPVAPKQVRKYNCFSRWMNHPPRTMRLERASWVLRGHQTPSNQNPVFASPGGGCRARSDASLPLIKRNCLTAYYRVCIRPLVNASVWKRGGTFDNLCDYCATKFRYFSVRLAQTVSRCPKGYNSEG
jgi:hypothetical protein